MLGLIVSVIVFNFLCFKFNKRLTNNHTLHIWLFTTCIQNLFDVFIDLKYHGYWYFTKGIDWQSLPAVTILIPPINILYLNYFPYKKSWPFQGIYILCWSGLVLAYEWLTLLPSPFGYFHYGWWKVQYSCILDPILFIVVVMYFQLIRHIEANEKNNRRFD